MTARKPPTGPTRAVLLRLSRRFRCMERHCELNKIPERAAAYAVARFEVSLELRKLDLAPRRAKKRATRKT